MNYLKLFCILTCATISFLSYSLQAKVGDTYNCSVENHIRHYYSSYTKQGSGPEDRFVSFR